MGIARSFCRRDAQQRRRLHAALGFKVEGVDESHSRLDPAYCARSMLAGSVVTFMTGATWKAIQQKLASAAHQRFS